MESDPVKIEKEMNELRDKLDKAEEKIKMYEEVVAVGSRRLLKKNPALLDAKGFSCPDQTMGIDILGMCFIWEKNFIPIANVNLSGKGIDDYMAAVIAESLKANTTITSLNFNDNQISDYGARKLGEALAVNKTLKSLILNNNYGIGDSGIQAIAEGMKSNSTLENLSLWCCSLHDAGVQAIANAMASNTTMKALSIWGNELTDEGVIPLCEALENASLSTFNLHAHRMSSAGIQALYKFLRNNKTVVSLTHEIPMKGDAYKWLCETLKENATLKTLNLGNHGFGDAEKKALCDAVRGKPGFNISFAWTNNGWKYEQL